MATNQVELETNLVKLKTNLVELKTNLVKMETNIVNHETQLKNVLFNIPMFLPTVEDFSEGVVVDQIIADIVFWVNFASQVVFPDLFGIFPQGATGVIFPAFMGQEITWQLNGTIFITVDIFINRS